MFILLIFFLAAGAAFGEEADSPYVLPADQFLRSAGTPGFHDLLSKSKSQDLPLPVSDPDAVKMRSDDPLMPPFLEEIAGASNLDVFTRSGRVRKVHAGQTFPLAETLKTAGSAGARVLMEDGTQILIAPNSELYALTFETAAGKVPGVEVVKGTARFLVPSSASADFAKAKYRFVVSSRSLAVGVVGTDFVVAVDQDNTAVHVMTGTVAAAESFPTLKGGRHVKVAPEQFTDRPDIKSPLREPEQFQLKPFFDTFSVKFPQQQELFQSAVAVAKRGNVTSKFQTLRYRLKLHEESARKKGSLVRAIEFKKTEKPSRMRGAAFR